MGVRALDSGKTEVGVVASWSEEGDTETDLCIESSMVAVCLRDGEFMLLEHGKTGLKMPAGGWDADFACLLIFSSFLKILLPVAAVIWQK